MNHWLLYYNIYGMTASDLEPCADYIESAAALDFGIWHIYICRSARE